MIEELKRRVCQANLDLVRHGLIVSTWGNASAFDPVSGMVVIKPSGVAYDSMKPSDMVAVSIKTGKPLDNHLRPSSDTATHLELYRAFKGMRGVVHTHSIYATAWAQACREIPPLGTTHADYFQGSIPCTRALRPKEIRENYELNTGLTIVERFQNLDPMTMRAILVAHHAPFTWGATIEEAVENAVVLEFVARLASETFRIKGKAARMPPSLLDKHFRRKHGPDAYYGQHGK